MATYYWVGGSGTWDNANNTNWSASSGGAGGVGPPTSADDVFFDSNSGTAATVTIAATAACLACTIDKSDINLSLSGSPTFSGTMTLTNGSITLNSYTLTCLTFSSSNANARTIAFDTGNITLTGNAAVVFDMATATAFVYTGTPVINLTYSGAVGTRTVRFGNTAGATESNVISLNVVSGTDIISFVGQWKNAIFTGFAGTITNSTPTIYGNYNVPSTATLSSGGSAAITFAGTSGTQQITTNGKTLDFPVTFNGVGGTFQLQDNLTAGASRTVTLTNGTLDLTGNNGNWTLTTAIFSSSNSNARAIKFGTGSISVTLNNSTPLAMSNITNFTYTGTPNVNATYSGSTGTRTFQHAITGAAEANVVSLNVTAGTDTVTIAAGSFFKNLIFSGFSGTITNSTTNVYGDYTISAGATLNAGTSATIFRSTSGIQKITTNGKTLDFPVTFSGVGGTFRFEDAFAIGSARALTLTNGTLNANDQNVSIGTFALGSGTKTLTLGSGTWTVAGANWNANTNVTGLTVSASTGTISMTSGSAKTFNGGGLTWPTLNQGGAGALTIAQSNTFANITNSTQPATITLTAGTTQTVNAFSLSGTAGNQITLNSSSAGSVATLYKASGKVSVSYINIRDVRAEGPCEWNAREDLGAVDQGNTPGWNFIREQVKRLFRRIMQNIVRPMFT